MATQKVPLTRIDETGASDGKVLKYSSGVIAWGDDNAGSGGGGSGTAFKNTILATESVSANSLEQYQVHSGLEILSGGTFTISASGDLILDAPDDPNKAAGWAHVHPHIATASLADSVCIGTQTPLHTDDKLSVAGGNLTVAGNVSAQGNVYGNARTMTNPGVVLQVSTSVKQDTQAISTSDVFTKIDGLSATLTPSSASSKFLVIANVTGSTSNCSLALKLIRDIGGTETDLGVATSAGSSEVAATFGASPYQVSYVSDSAGYSFLDSPNTTEQVTYAIGADPTYDGATLYINRSSTEANYTARFSSSITVMEIAG